MAHIQNTMPEKYSVYATEEFLNDYQKLSKIERERIEKIREQLKVNPYVGKPLGYKFFREKRVDGKRIYYLVYEDVVIVLMVAISDKKTQQSTINAIKMTFDIYKKDIYEKFKK